MSGRRTAGFGKPRKMCYRCSDGLSAWALVQVGAHSVPAWFRGIGVTRAGTGRGVCSLYSYPGSSSQDT